MSAVSGEWSFWSWPPVAMQRPAWPKRSGFAKWSAQPITVKDISINATVSVGVATSHELSAQHMEALLSAADEALYRAKEKGRNRVEGESSPVLLSATPGPPVGAVRE